MFTNKGDYKEDFKELPRKKNVTRIGQFKITDTQNQIVFLYGGQKKITN